MEVNFKLTKKYLEGIYDNMHELYEDSNPDFKAGYGFSTMISHAVTMLTAPVVFPIETAFIGVFAVYDIVEDLQEKNSLKKFK